MIILLRFCFIKFPIANNNYDFIHTDLVGFSQNLYTVQERNNDMAIILKIFSYISITSFDDITVNFTTISGAAIEGNTFFTNKIKSFTIIGS